MYVCGAAPAEVCWGKKIRISFTVSSGWSLELSLDGEQGHVPHQPGFSDHQARVIRLRNIKTQSFCHVFTLIYWNIPGDVT